MTRRPVSVDINWEMSTLRSDNWIFEFELSEFQKDLIRNGGSVGVMVKLAAQLQGEGVLG